MNAPDTWLIAGLGNPGRKYANTRHNVGFMAVEKIGAHHGIAISRNMFKNRYGRGHINGKVAILAQPQNYMNRSGPPVYQLARYFGIDTARIVVIHDDMDIDKGRIKIKTKGGHGGHNGIQSIIAALGSKEFIRIRIGIGRPESEGPDAHGADGSDFVLGKIPKPEQAGYETAFESVREAIEIIMEKGAAAAMNRLHGQRSPE